MVVSVQKVSPSITIPDPPPRMTRSSARAVAEVRRGQGGDQQDEQREHRDELTRDDFVRTLQDTPIDGPGP